MRVAACQIDIQWEDRAANMATVGRMLRDAALPPDSLVALPEMFATGFSMNAEQICSGGAEVGALAAELKVHIIAGEPCRTADGHANVAVIGTPDGNHREIYRKRRLFAPAREDKHYLAGERAQTLLWRRMSVSPLICYDLRFPELFRDGLALGAQMFVVIANWPAVRQNHWRTLLAARAIENQAYVVGVNRCGKDPHHAYAGGSVIFDPWGNVLAEAGGEPCVISAEVDPQVVERYRREFPGGAREIISSR